MSQSEVIQRAIVDFLSDEDNLDAFDIGPGYVDLSTSEVVIDATLDLGALSNFIAERLGN